MDFPLPSMVSDWIQQISTFFGISAFPHGPETCTRSGHAHSECELKKIGGTSTFSDILDDQTDLPCSMSDALRFNCAANLRIRWSCNLWEVESPVVSEQSQAPSSAQQRR